MVESVEGGSTRRACRPVRAADGRDGTDPSWPATIAATLADEFAGLLEAGFVEEVVRTYASCFGTGDAVNASVRVAVERASRAALATRVGAMSGREPCLIGRSRR